MLARLDLAAREDHALSFHETANAFLVLGGLGVHPDLLALTDAGWIPITVQTGEAFLVVPTI